MQKSPKMFENITKSEINDIKIVISDFDGVFTDNKVYVNENGGEQVKCSRLDGIGISKLKLIDIEIVVVSSEPNNVVLERCKKLKIEAYNNVNNKGDFVKNLLDIKNLKRKNALFIGNDENDIPAIEHVKFAVGVADSYETFYQSASYMLSQNGGDGAIRQLCEILVKKKTEI